MLGPQPALWQRVPAATLHDSASADSHELARRQLSDVHEGRALARAPKEAEVSLDGREVQRITGGRQYRERLNLARKGQPCERLAEIQWLHTKCIAGEQQFPAATIVDGECEYPIEPWKHCQAISQIEAEH